ncbi:hypothetical protein ABBQ38_009236 [Trebouxia sp. C0009 RCD-2024]
MSVDDVEHTLFVCRQVNLYRVPPKATAGGHKSGEWKVADKIFTGRLKLTAKGEAAEVRLEDSDTGDLFAMCPVPHGQRDIAVEPASDSSRNFVLRVVDPVSKRHAFLGLGFSERHEAFDFNVALSDHEKHMQRAKEVSSAASSAASGSSMAPAIAQSDAAALYKKQDLSLKEGQTIKIAMKRPSSAEGGGMLASLGGGSKGTGGSAVLKPLAPPPSYTPTQGQQGQQSGGAQQSQGSNSHSLLGNDFSDFAGAPAPAASQPQSKQSPATPSSWATF